MKSRIIYILAIFGSLVFFSCGKNYDANPGSNANQSANPLNPLDAAAFNLWTDSAAALSGYVNGTYFNFDSTHVTWALSSQGTDSLYGVSSTGGQGFILSLYLVYKGGIYPINDSTNNGITNRTWGRYFVTTPTYKAWNTSGTLMGNVGQVQILRNDNRIIGRFYFQSLDTIAGNVVNISEGYFNVSKY